MVGETIDGHVVASGDGTKTFVAKLTFTQDGGWQPLDADWEVRVDGYAPVPFSPFAAVRGR